MHLPEPSPDSPPPRPSPYARGTAAADPASGGPAGDRRGAGSGTTLVIGLVMLGLAAAVTAIVFQRGQTGRCLAFYGAEVARQITSAPVVELVSDAPAGGDGPASFRRDVSKAPGLVHLRRGLVEDANFDWKADPAEPVTPGAGGATLVFSDPGGVGPPVTLRIDLADATAGPGPRGALTVEGRPGRLTLGRIGKGLATWLEKTR